MKEPIYAVWTQADEEGRTSKIIGYATGNEDAIVGFFSAKKFYSISLSEIHVVNVTEEDVRKQKLLLEERSDLINRVRGIDAQINDINPY